MLMLSGSAHVPQPVSGSLKMSELRFRGRDVAFVERDGNRGCLVSLPYTVWDRHSPFLFPVCIIHDEPSETFRLLVDNDLDVRSRV